MLQYKLVTGWGKKRAVHTVWFRFVCLGEYGEPGSQEYLVRHSAAGNRTSMGKVWWMCGECNRCDPTLGLLNSEVPSVWWNLHNPYITTWLVSSLCSGLYSDVALLRPSVTVLFKTKHHCSLFPPLPHIVHIVLVSKVFSMKHPKFTSIFK